MIVKPIICKLYGHDWETIEVPRGIRERVVLAWVIPRVMRCGIRHDTNEVESCRRCNEVRPK